MSPSRLLTWITAAMLALAPVHAVAQEPASDVAEPGAAFPDALPESLVEGAHWATTAPTAPLFFDDSDPFYLPPEELPAGPGQLIRTQPATHLLNLAGPEFPGHAYKILYTSTTMHGDPVATSGFVIEPARAWTGQGPTPTLVFAPGTRGAGDACAPSRGPWLAGFHGPITEQSNPNYELAFYYAASLYGMRVVVTDYIGLGTPGVHTYVNSIEEAHAVLDAARAVVPAGEPVGFSGYSQGGGAAAAAAEHAATYAPELNVKGTYAGAAPADLGEVMDAIDGSVLTGVLGYAIAGFAARDVVAAAELDAVLSPTGQEFVRDNVSACVTDSNRRWGFRDTADLTTTGQRLSEAMAQQPAVRRIIDEQKLGGRLPNAPVFITSGDGDTIVPNGQVRQLGRDYCALGAEVYYQSSPTPPLPTGYHAYGLIADQPSALNYLMDRFNGVPAPNNCGSF